MEAKELMKEFETLYNTMANANNPKFMNIFGKTMKAMMNDMVVVKPELAQEYIDKLNAIEWNNYLTKKETMEIIDSMNPAPMWDAATWLDSMEKTELIMSEKPYYNDYALYVTMNQMLSDHGNTIASILSKNAISEVDVNELTKIAYRLAIDLLKDKDNMYDIRRYFLK